MGVIFEIIGVCTVITAITAIVVAYVYAVKETKEMIRKDVENSELNFFFGCE